MKKIIALLLVITSLFALSSSALCFGTWESSKTAETEILSDVKTTEEKKKKIEEFLNEKRNYFPENKLVEICHFLSKLSDTELEIALSLNFKNPKLLTLTAILGGAIGADRFALGSSIRGVSKLTLTTVNALVFAEPLSTTSFEGAYDFFKCCMFVTLPTIISWIASIATASRRAREYNYQLLKDI